MGQAFLDTIVQDRIDRRRCCSCGLGSRAPRRQPPHAYQRAVVHHTTQSPPAPCMLTQGRAPCNPHVLIEEMGCAVRPRDPPIPLSGGLCCVIPAPSAGGGGPLDRVGTAGCDDAYTHTFTDPSIASHDRLTDSPPRTHSQPRTTRPPTGIDGGGAAPHRCCCPRDRRVVGSSG